MLMRTALKMMLQLMTIVLIGDSCRAHFTKKVEPKISGKRISARDRRIILTRIVAKAHRLTVAGNDAKRWQKFKAIGYLRATPSDTNLRVFPSYIFSPMSEVEQQVRAAIDARARQEAVHVREEAPIRLPSFKAKQKPINL